MNVTEPTWLEPLCTLLAVVRAPEPGKEGLAKMMTALAEVEALLTQNRAEMPSELVHFLERRSYEKAAQYCAGAQGVARGICGAKS